MCLVLASKQESNSACISSNAEGLARQWIRELNYKNELKAWIGARRKAIATLDTYRVVHELSPDEVVYCVKGSVLVKD